MTDNYTNNLPNNLQNQACLISALQWHIDNGVDELLSDMPIDRTVVPDVPSIIAKTPPLKLQPLSQNPTQDSQEVMGTAAAIEEARNAAAACQTLEELQKAIMNFNGLSIKKNATNMVFSDGSPDAPIMLIGEAPGADEDAQGKPFVGVSGQLLDKILACIDLDRKSEKPEQGVYISNILNWRPPGNRTPTTSEMEISLPFIERHIALVQPKMIILCGGVAGKTLLKRDETISKLRGNFHDYVVNGHNIPAMATYHPAYLLRTPAQKKAVWADMLMFQAKMKEIL